MLADEEDSLAWVDGENPFGDLDPAQRRKPDVQQNQIGLELRGLLDGFGTIRGFADDVPLVCGLQHAPNMASPWFVVVDNQHAVNHVHEFFLGAYSSNFGQRTQYAVKKKFIGNVNGAIAPNAQLSLVFVNVTSKFSSIAYIDEDLEPVVYMVAEEFQTRESLNEFGQEEILGRRSSL